MLSSSWEIAATILCSFIEMLGLSVIYFIRSGKPIDCVSTFFLLIEVVWCIFLGVGYYVIL